MAREKRRQKSASSDSRYCATRRAASLCGRPSSIVGTALRPERTTTPMPRSPSLPSSAEDSVTSPRMNTRDSGASGTVPMRSPFS
jgi:hypothetical protein